MFDTCLISSCEFVYEGELLIFGVGWSVCLNNGRRGECYGNWLKKQFLYLLFRLVIRLEKHKY